MERKPLFPGRDHVHQLRLLMEGKGLKHGIYRSTWEKTQEQVNKFSGASRRSFYSRDDAKKAFDAYMNKQVSTSSSPSSFEESSHAASRASENRFPTQAKKLDKLKDALSNLANENDKHAARVEEIMEDIKKQLASLEISG